MAMSHGGYRWGTKRTACAVHSEKIIRWFLVGIMMLWVGGNVLVDFCPWRYRFPEGDYLVNHIPTGDASPVAITFGNSRFRCGLYADELGQLAGEALGQSGPVSVYAGAVPAGTAITFYPMLERMLARGAEPKLVLVEISPETVAQYAPWLEFDTMRHFNFFQTITAIPDGLRSRSQSRLLSSTMVPLYRHNLQLVDWLRETVGLEPEGEPGVEIARPNRFTKLLGPKDDPLTDAPMRKWFRRYRVGGTQVHNMDRLLQLCKDHGIKVLLVGIPVSTRHRAHYTPEVERQYHQYVDSLKSRFGASFMDFSDRIPDSDFADYHHMVEQGGVLFTRIVAQEYFIPELHQLQNRESAQAGG